MKYRFFCASNIHFALNAISYIPKLLKKATPEPRPLLVTDKGLRDAGLLDALLAVLTDDKLEAVIFDEVEVNPRFKTVDSAAAVYQAGGCNCLIALGGAAILGGMISMHKKRAEGYGFKYGGGGGVP
ncbi:MAG: iron-containing alcohol dehydrogenase [Thermodesulfobacteriota bacterium]